MLRPVGPCDICGDVGFPEVIATCSKCNIVCEHVYCMQIFLKEVPEDWLCESCHLKNGTTSPKCGGNKKSSRGFGSDASNITHHDIVHTISPCKVNQDSGWQASKKQRPVATGKVKFIPEDEVIKLSCGNFSLKPIPSNTRKTSVGSERVISKIPSLSLKSNSSIAPVGLGKFARNSGIHKNPANDQHASCFLSKMVSTSEKKAPVTLVEKSNCREESLGSIRPVSKAETSKAITDKSNDKASCSSAISLHITTAGPSKEHIWENQQLMGELMPDKEVQTLDLQIEKPAKGAPCEALSARKSSPIVGSGGILCAVAECNRSIIEKSNLQSIQPNLKLYHKFLPSSLATWRGEFQILQAAASGEFYDGFEAQPPCTVNSKAYQFSSRMPSVLQLESVPMLNLLTDVFQNDCPSLQDIALYFFPSDNIERSRKNLNSIFEFMNAEKSMLRSFIDGVELFVFTSKQLNVDSRGTIATVNSGYFLWGIFRQKKIDKAIERLPDMEPVDMDIDMVGGKDVLGRIDHVRKDKPRSLSDRSLEGTPLQSTSKKLEEKTLITSSHLNFCVLDKLALPTEFRKKFNTEFCSDPSLWNSVNEYSNPLDKLDVPPGFEAKFSRKTAVNEEKSVVNGGRSLSPCKNKRMLCGTFRM